MRKLKIFFLSIGIIIVSFCNAQGETKFGVGAGLNLSNFTGQNGGSDKLLGFNGGIFAEYKFPSIVGIEIDFLYSQKGAKVQYVFGKEDFETNYFDIPIVLKIYNLKILNFQLGIQQSLLNGPKGRDNQFKTSDFSLVFGFGVDVNRFHFSTRYTYSMTSISVRDDYEILNSVLTFTAGIWLKK